VRIARLATSEHPCALQCCFRIRKLEIHTQAELCPDQLPLT